MKKLWISAACGALALTACAPADPNREADATADAATTEAVNAASADMPRRTASSGDTAFPPTISTNVAPRVAFSHDYLFELPNKAISQVQEAHSRKCEELGLSQCEVTGMEYRLDKDGAVSASTSFLLSPKVAGVFGTSAIAAVNAADGTLVEGDVRGEDAGGAIAQAKAENSDRSRRIAELERRLATLKIGAAERSRIAEELSELRNQNAQSDAIQREARAKLERSPVTFSYKSRSGFLGFSSGDGVAGYATTSFSLVASLVAVVAPWLLMLAGAIWLWRRLAASRKTVVTPEVAG